MEVFRRWNMAISAFALDLVRLQHPLSILYLMTVNFAFCFVAFYASREIQFRCLYALIAAVFFMDFMLVGRRHNLAIEFFHWIVSDFLKFLAILLCAFSINELYEKREKRAFFSSLLAVCAIVSSPIYKYHKINAKIVNFTRRLVRWFKQFVARYIVSPLFLLWDWIKYIVLFRWLPVLGLHFRSWFLSVWDWLDSRLFHPLRQFGASIRAWFVYLFFFHWCVDLSAWLKRAIIDPSCVRLSRLLDAFIYVFGCYWLKPLLKQIGSVFLDLSKVGFRMMAHASYLLAALCYEHVLCPLLILCGDRVEQFSIYLYNAAIHPFLAICYRKYRMMEDWMLIYIIGPVLKKFLDWMPERNPFDHDSDHELDDFIPDADDERGAGANAVDAAEERDSAMHSDDDGNASLSDLASSRHSFESDKLLASGLKRIAISDSDSEVDEFLPISTRKRLRK